MIAVDLDEVLNDSEEWPSDEEIMACKHLFAGIEDVIQELVGHGTAVVTWLHGAEGKPQPVIWPIPHRHHQGNTSTGGIMAAYSGRGDH